MTPLFQALQRGLGAVIGHNTSSKQKNQFTEKPSGKQPVVEPSKSLEKGISQDPIAVEEDLSATEAKAEASEGNASAKSAEKTTATTAKDLPKARTPQTIGQEVSETVLRLMEKHPSKQVHDALKCLNWEGFGTNYNYMLDSMQSTCSGSWKSRLSVRPFAQQMFNGVSSHITHPELKKAAEATFNKVTTTPATTFVQTIKVPKTVQRPQNETARETAERIGKSVATHLEKNPDAFRQFKDCDWRGMVEHIAACISEIHKNSMLPGMYRLVPTSIKNVIFRDPRLLELADTFCATGA